MCGIIGYIGADARAREPRVVAGRERMQHRGPDDAGVFLSDVACLASRRLAVLDLSQAGHMPMQSPDGRYVIVYNGEIYNFAELRADLARSIEFHSTGDTEVILNGFRVWGFSGLLDRVDGMFAFAIWDAAQRRLYAARDRIGEKPFFHAHTHAGFAFASTLEALLTLTGDTPTVDPHALDAYLTYQAVPAPLSIYRGIHQLLPAHALTYDASRGTVDIERYWDVAYAPKQKITESDALNAIDELLRRSVRTRLRSDVATGTLLSGGVDSSLITALATQERGSSIDSVTLGYDGPTADEREYARVVAAQYKVRLHEEMLTPHVVRDLPRIVAHYGQPLADVSIVPNFYLAESARHFMTVALVGDGADEVFGGYARPIVARAAQPYRSLVPSPIRRALGQLLRESPGSRSTNDLRRRFALLAQAGAGSAQDAFVYERGFRSLREGYGEWLRQETTDWHPDSLYAAAWSRAVAADDVDRALYGDLTTYLPDQLLAKADVSSMAHGLETRSPFLARDIVEFAATLPNDLRLKGFTTKYLLKRVAERYLPAAVLHRPKRGFVIPASQWLRHELSPYLAALNTPRFLDRGWISPDLVRGLVAEHLSGAKDWGNQLWTLLVLEVWARQSLDRTMTAASTLDDLLVAK
jgi:asparagine synthase (glutamine-hydrolysing)